MSYALEETLRVENAKNMNFSTQPHKTTKNTFGLVPNEESFLIRAKAFWEASIWQRRRKNKSYGHFYGVLTFITCHLHFN